MSAVVADAIRSATLVVIPTRPTLFDLSAVRETIDLCRASRKPYAVVINAAPSKREDVESPIVTQAREGLAKLRVPVWAGQISNRTNFSIALAAGEGAREYDAESAATAEISRACGPRSPSRSRPFTATTKAPPCIAPRRDRGLEPRFESAGRQHHCRRPLVAYVCRHGLRNTGMVDPFVTKSLHFVIHKETKP